MTTDKYDLSPEELEMIRLKRKEAEEREMNKNLPDESQTIEEVLAEMENEESRPVVVEEETIPLEPSYSGTVIPVEAVQPLRQLDDMIPLEKINRTEPKAKPEYTQVEATMEVQKRHEEVQPLPDHTQMLTDLAIDLEELETSPDNPAPQFKPISEPTKPAAQAPKPDKVEEIKTRVSKRDKAKAEYWDPSLVKNSEYKAPSKPVERDPSHPIFVGEHKFDPKNRDDIVVLSDSLALPCDSRENILNVVNNNPTVLDDKFGEIKISSMTEAMELGGFESEFVGRAINEEGVELKHALERPGTNERTFSRKSIIPEQGGKLTGLQARVAIKSRSGVASYRTVYLPHSGIVAIVAAPVVHELVDLQAVLDNAKINVGRSYGGSNYGSATWFINHEIFKLFVKKIDYINIANYTPELLEELIDPMDFPTIAWQLAAAKYPEGYRYNRTVLNTDGTSDLVLGTLRLDDCQFYLNSRLSTRQKQHLEKAVRVRSSREEILSYQRDWKNEDEIKPVRVLLTEQEAVFNGEKVKQQMFVSLGKSTVADYVRHGSDWDVYLRESINEVLTLSADEKTRSDYLGRKIMATALREYSHLIKDIVTTTTYENGETIESVIEGDEFIIDLLDDIVDNPVASDKLREGILEFVNSQVKVVYGVPIANELDETSEHSNAIVPLNPIVLFFTLTGRTYQRLAA